MSDLVADCPRCGSSRITFDLLSEKLVGVQYRWQQWYEAFCICRHCGRSTVFVLSDRETDSKRIINETGLSKVGIAVNNLVSVESVISLKDRAAVEPPEHLPDAIKAAFNEGARCLSVACFNGAGTMFRLCVDIATRALLPEREEPGLTSKTRRDLGLRLPWLFERGLLPESLRELSSCIKEDGNDGAHAGSLGKPEAEDLLDFTTALLERLYTEPERLRIAKERRDARRTST